MGGYAAVPGAGAGAGLLFTLGDYAAGAAVGALTAGSVRALVTPDVDMVLAMLLGMAAGMLVHLVAGFVLRPLLGMFHVMVPGSLIGMYGGMLFGMRDAMAHRPESLREVLVVGVAFGVAVTAFVHAYDRSLRGRERPRSSA